MKVSSNRRIVGCAIKEKSSLGMCEWENGIEEFCWEIFTLNRLIFPHNRGRIAADFVVKRWKSGEV